MNKCCIVGRVTRDLELRHTQSGIANISFSLAVDKGLSRQKREEFEAQGRPTADFPRVVVWGQMAENLARYCGKGSQIAVVGRIETGSYEDKKFNTNTPVNIYEKSNELKIEILIPGRTKEDIDIDISDDIIHVTSKIKEDDNDYYHKSINKEDVSLSWKVSDKFDLSKTSAKYEGGILELTILLNKEKEKLNKKIKIA